MNRNSSTSYHFGVAAFMGRIVAAFAALISLRIGMWFYGLPLTEPYKALMIIVPLLALILFIGRPRIPLETRMSIWSAAIPMLGSWLALVIVLLVIGYATKTSAMFSRKLLISWALVTPALILAAQLLIDTIFSRIWQSSGNRRKVVIAGVNEHGLLLQKKSEVIAS